jgi:magnesium-protoporphyrin O-methyltransferase
MTCCQAPAWAAQFHEKLAIRDLRDYRKHGPAATTQALIDALVRAGVQQATMLDIGGGVGAIQFELLDAGAREAVSVDASAAYLDAARREAERRGVSGRIRSYRGDFVALAPELPAADIVTLDRVVCCYADMEPLVRLSAERCRRLYGLVYPRDQWVERTVVHVQNLFRALWRNPFRSFVHPVAAMDALLRSLGFALRSKVRTFAWEVAVYERVTRP